MTAPSVGFSDFYINNSRREMGNSYTILPHLSIMSLVHSNWGQRKAGTGEEGLDRKVLVPVPECDLNLFGVPAFFCPPRVKLVAGMPLHAIAMTRQEGEEPHVELFITPEDAANYEYIETPAKCAYFVVYSEQALLENNGKRSSHCEWEIVTLLCSEGGLEPMTPLTMARNQLEKAGGTKPEKPYTSEEWALAVWKNASRGVKVRAKKP